MKPKIRKLTKAETEETFPEVVIPEDSPPVEVECKVSKSGKHKAFSWIGEESWCVYCRAPLSDDTNLQVA